MLARLRTLKAWAGRHVPAQCRDDFTQSVALMWLEGNRLDAAFKWLWVDYVRREWDVVAEYIDTPNDIQEHPISLSHVIPRSGRTRAFMVLLLLGYSQKEIAFIFGIDQATVSREIK